MSFKRDGDDISLLNRLKHRRVSELLGECVPEDEAKLLSNGRLTCLVCTQRPIFDTMNMLAKHRQGKKHLFELTKYIQRNERLELEKLKREQKIYLENCRKAELANMKVNSLVLGPRDNFSSSSSESNANNRRRVLEVPEVVYKPAVEQCSEKKNSSKSSSSQLKKYLKRIKKKPHLEKLVEKQKSGYSSVICNAQETGELPSISQSCKEDVNSVKQAYSPVTGDIDMSRNLSGWIKDKFGNWIKDPEAEFDTDDEEVNV